MKNLEPKSVACFTVDVEQDCPPYLETVRGMNEGMPRLLDLLGDLQVPGTFFTTGEMARRFPSVIRRIVAEGHELACHGDQHKDFTTLTREETRNELGESLTTLRDFAPVISFRAPYLRFPAAQLPLLMEHGLRIDSSQASYKLGANHKANDVAGLIRIPASLTSSVLRLPSLLRKPWIASVKPPAVLFVHPWEAVDFRHSSLRWDCRFRTGDAALNLWRDVLMELLARGTVFNVLRVIADQISATKAETLTSLDR